MRNVLQLQSHVSFLHEELQKLPSFPRKALEADFGLYHAEFGKEVYGVDNLHKYVWTKVWLNTVFKHHLKEFFCVISQEFLLFFPQNFLRWKLPFLLCNTSMSCLKHVFPPPTFFRNYMSVQDSIIIIAGHLQTQSHMLLW